MRRTQTGKTRTRHLPAQATAHQLDVSLAALGASVCGEHDRGVDAHLSSLVDAENTRGQLDDVLSLRQMGIGVHRGVQPVVRDVVLDEHGQIVPSGLHVGVHVLVEPDGARRERGERGVCLGEIEGLLVPLCGRRSIALVPRDEPEGDPGGDLHAFEQDFTPLRALEAGVNPGRGGGGRRTERV